MRGHNISSFANVTKHSVLIVCLYSLLSH